MTYHCPNCAFGHLVQIKSTYVRRLGSQIFTLPNFLAWRCDCCGYTRYDAGAMARIDALLGPEAEDWDSPHRPRSRNVEGPGERGPRRWSL